MLTVNERARRQVLASPHWTIGSIAYFTVRFRGPNPRAEARPLIWLAGASGPKPDPPGCGGGGLTCTPARSWTLDGRTAFVLKMMIVRTLTISFGRPRTGTSFPSSGRSGSVLTVHHIFPVRHHHWHRHHRIHISHHL